MKKTFTGWIYKPRIDEVGSKVNKDRGESFFYIPTIYQKDDNYNDSIV